jgi:hypothetical protein
MFVHRIVAAAFIGPCPDGLEINHKNGIKLDNRAENLEYTTRSANMKHAYDSGLRRREFLGTQWRGGRAHGQTAASPQKGSTNV